MGPIFQGGLPGGCHSGEWHCGAQALTRAYKVSWKICQEASQAPSYASGTDSLITRTHCSVGNLGNLFLHRGRCNEAIRNGHHTPSLRYTLLYLHLVPVNHRSLDQTFRGTFGRLNSAVSIITGESLYWEELEGRSSIKTCGTDSQGDIAPTPWS